MVASETLFQSFKMQMPNNAELCNRVCDRILADQSNAEIKENFSLLVVAIHDGIYKEYLSEQEKIGQSLIDGKISIDGTINFVEFDRFLMSIGQSRKSRAGKAFEIIIETLLTRLGYPFAEQVDIDGAKPDYILPSEEMFRAKPLDCLLLTAKRTLRERWRQVVTEANKSYAYFLATFDEQISSNQLKAASEQKIYVVVPKDRIDSNSDYDDAYNVISFEDFFLKHLDPAMNRWGIEVKEPTSDYRSDLFK